jgi:uncharacterized protein (TIGR02147 family)
MDFKWTASDYREIVNECLGYRHKRRPRGAIKKISEALSCHPTFIAQVLKGRAEFSLEQGHGIADHFNFTEEQKDFFLTTLLRDRAGTTKLREFLQSKLNKALEAKMDLKKKLRAVEPRLADFELEYFGNWMYQTIHAFTQIPRLQSANPISKVLDIPVEEVEWILNRLQKMGLVKNERNYWKSTRDSLHLPKKSRFIRQLRLTWQQKLLSDLQGGDASEGTRFSGLITVSEKDYQKVRDLIVEALGQIRSIVSTSNPQKVCILSLDCHKIANVP